MSQGMTVDIRQVKTGALTTQVFIPRRQPKLALNRSHYLLADETKTVEVDLGGVKREAFVLCKVWIPVPRKERADECTRAALKREKFYSPMLR